MRQKQAEEEEEEEGTGGRHKALGVGMCPLQQFAGGCRPRPGALAAQHCTALAAAQPKTMELPPPGGASTREEGLSVMKLLQGRQGGRGGGQGWGSR